MHPRLLTILLLALSPLVSACASNFKSLVDGDSSDGWIGAVERHTFSGGIIQPKKGKGGSIYTKKKYTNFIVRLEFKLPEGGNNGLAIRYPGHGNPAYSGMCELQVLDNTAEKYTELDERQYHGSAYGMVASERGHLKPVGEWNQQTVTVVGSTIRVVLNGVIILDTDLSEVTEFMDDKAHPGKDIKSGHFGFAGHNSPVTFRNIEIKELPHAN